MSNTPRTDAEQKRTARIAADSGLEQAWEDMCAFAKNLERELGEYQGALSISTDAVQKMLDAVRDFDQALRAIAAAHPMPAPIELKQKRRHAKQ